MEAPSHLFFFPASFVPGSKDTNNPELTKVAYFYA